MVQDLLQSADWYLSDSVVRFPGPPWFGASPAGLATLSLSGEDHKPRPSLENHIE